MEKMDFYVYLSPKEAAEKVKEAVTAGLYSGEILDEYKANPAGWQGNHHGAVREILYALRQQSHADLFGG